MDGVIAGILAAWCVFASAIAFYSLGSSNVTTKVEIIRLCKEVNQFQYETTIVECKVKSKE